VSIFKFEDTIDAEVFAIEVTDSEDVPGTLEIKCTDARCEIAIAIDLPREQVEKLYATLGKWLKP
jgi:hypothetical protein